MERIREMIYGAETWRQNGRIKEVVVAMPDEGNERVRRE